MKWSDLNVHSSYFTSMQIVSRSCISASNVLIFVFVSVLFWRYPVSFSCFWVHSGLQFDHGKLKATEAICLDLSLFFSLPRCASLMHTLSPLSELPPCLRKDSTGFLIHVRNQGAFLHCLDIWLVRKYSFSVWDWMTVGCPKSLSEFPWAIRMKENIKDTVVMIWRGSYLPMVRIYSWFCAQGPLLAAQGTIQRDRIQVCHILATRQKPYLLCYCSRSRPNQYKVLIFLENFFFPFFIGFGFSCFVLFLSHIQLCSGHQQ